MKRSLTILLMATLSVIYAQDELEKRVGDFSTLKVYDLINVEMIKSDENKAVVKGSDKYDVEFVNRNGTLKIRMSPENAFDGDDTFITLYYTEIDVIDANEGSRISVKDVIDQYEIDLKTQEGAKIETELKVTYANIRAVTGGIINANGSAKNQDVSIYTGGMYEGKELMTEFSEVSIQAGGEIKVNCTDRLEIKIKAGGDVYIYGNPKLVDENRVFGGRVKRM
ncbi:MAG: head GIN domain-containing protein [Bacteroidota bacterium]